MKIDFMSIDFKNVLSYGNKFTTFNFNEGIDLITAKNGNGKSSFIDALTFGLYGKPFRKIKIGSLINHHNNKELEVRVTFKVENKGYYYVVRGLKPNKFEIYFNKDEAVFEEKHLIPQESTTIKYQDVLENNILKMNENVYRQLIVLGANISGSKNFMDLSSKEKEEVFQIITDTSVFNDLRALVKKKIQVANTYVLDHEYKVNILNNNLDSEKRNLLSLEEQNKVIKKDKEKIISDLEIELEQKRGQVPVYEDAITKLKKLKEIYDAENSELLEKKNELQDLYLQKRKLSDDLHHIDRAKEGLIVCDQCDNHINLTTVNIEEEHHIKVKQDYDIINNKIEEKETYIKELEEKVTFKKEKLLNSKRIIQNQKDNLDRIDFLLKDIEDKNSWKELTIDYSNLHKLEEELESEKQTILALKEEINNYNIINTIISDDELKGFTLSQQIPLLNRYINQFIERFNAFEYNFVIDTAFKERIISRNEEKEFNSMSNGQKQRFTFSILFAFLKLVEEKNGVSTNLLILDEVLDSSSDAEGKLELIKILVDDFSKSKDVIIISHNPDILQNIEEFSRIIKIEHDNYSNMVVE